MTQIIVVLSGILSVIAFLGVATSVIESMSHIQFEMIQEFFATMPKVKHSVKIKNPNTGVESEVVLEGLSDFF